MAEVRYKWSSRDASGAGLNAVKDFQQDVTRSCDTRQIRFDEARKLAVPCFSCENTDLIYNYQIK